MTKLINLTPHPVKIVDVEGNVVREILPESTPLRLVEEVVLIGEIGGIPFVRKSLKTETEQLLPHLNGTYYIVSLPVAQAMKRTDLLVPDDLVRDKSGQVVGARRLATLV